MNKVYIVLAIAAVLALAIAAYKIFGLDRIRHWLLWAVTQAEAEYGAKTGKLKLAYVYELFTNKFPKLQAIVPFALFSKLVDAALVAMKAMLENKNIADIVKGEEVRHCGNSV